MKPAILLTLLAFLPIVAAAPDSWGAAGGLQVQVGDPSDGPEQGASYVAYLATASDPAHDVTAALVSIHGCKATVVAPGPGPASLAGSLTLTMARQSCSALVRFDELDGATVVASVFVSFATTAGTADQALAYWIPVCLAFVVMLAGIQWKNPFVGVVGTLGLLLTMLSGLSYGWPFLLLLLTIGIVVPGWWQMFKAKKQKGDVN